jgi:hypothetical protein
MDTANLYLKCKEKNCGIEFKSGIVMDKESYRTCVLEGNLHTCPKGHTCQYSKKDYFFK